MSKIKKVVFPVAGLGTRFLPATKAMPKEMLPIVDKPLIQYAVEEAIDAGFTEIIFVTGRNKRSIEDHFDKAYELETELESKNKDKLLESVQGIIPKGVTCLYIRQEEAIGLGHAVLKAKATIGNDEAFAVVLADDLIDAPNKALSQMVEVYNQAGCSILGVETIDITNSASYGMVKVVEEDGLNYVEQIIEKPHPSESPSNLAVVGRYILTPLIFNLLTQTLRGAGGEIQLTDAIAKLLQYEKVVAYPFIGKRYDCGSKIGYLIANLEYGLRHHETKEKLEAYIRNLNK